MFLRSNSFAAVSRNFRRTRTLNSYRPQTQVAGSFEDSIVKYSTLVGDQDLLHKSIVPTDHFQWSLPRLPVPELANTCQRYLKSQQVILSDQEYARTEAAVKQFLNADGPVLHKELVAMDKENKHTSYISEPWFDMYLADRRPVVLNHNPFMAFTDDSKPEYMNQLIRATNMVVSSLRFMKTYRANLLEPDIFHLYPDKSDTLQFRKFVRLLPKSVSFYGAYWYKAFPLDMSQYPRLFNSTRIPRHDKDQLFTDVTAKHLLVLRNGHFYIFDVLDRDGSIVAPNVIMSHISYILEDKRPPPEHPIAALCTGNRDKWASNRIQLANAGVMNEKTLKLIDSAVFALILDDHAPTDPNEITRTFLHGDGVSRWFDKSFQLILTKDGRAAVNFEHAWGDGVAVLRYFNEVWKETTTKPFVHLTTPKAKVDSSAHVQHLDFMLDPILQENIKTAKSDFDRHVKSIGLDHLEYQTFNKSYIKKQKLSPDSVLQLAIQLAYTRQYGKTVATYESCSTAAFKHGRTETIRSATMATKTACDLFLNPKKNPTVADLRAAMLECSNVHSQLTKEAAMGQGFDRHLFALKYLAQNKGSLPDFFKDPSYAKLNHIILSTSTLSSPAVVIGGFGAVTPDGYGVGYSVEDSRIGFNVTNYPPATDVHGFINCLKQSLNDIYAVFDGKLPMKS
ncbi:hypothetical protein ACJMK2_016467 [Sinanodonta woodiana]|uniref:Choline/carnitine acyltransferase domain-containing protein n=1 Tax=Sinanodonta woodiana TaxID=1069815 RepID=A0ABD3UX99_SINWO